MNEREQIILKRLLTFLKTLDGNTVGEPQIFEAVSHNHTPRLLRREIEDMLHFADSNNWITGVFSKTFGPKWSINDDGIAQLSQMN